MKKILLAAIALCFVGAGNFEVLSQKRTAAKKPVKRKLVKCKVNGKIVYRTSCRTKKLSNPEITMPVPVVDWRYEITRPDVLTGGGQGAGSGTGMGSGAGNAEKENTADKDLPLKPKPTNATQNVTILSKPRPIYTDQARQNMIQGQVVLRVTFLANGKIGKIMPVKGLPDGLTDQAIAAAKGIRFEPALRKGRPYTKVLVVSYSFTIY